MHRISRPFLLVLLCCALAACDNATPAIPDPDSGPAQSPMEIVPQNVTVTSSLPALEIEYSTATTLSVVNTGSPGEEETIKAYVAAGAGVLTMDGTAYDLLQFHWHTPSEHRPLGRTFPLEMHLVHRSQTSDTLLVLGVLIEQGAESEALAEIFEHLPPTESDEVEIPSFDLNQLLPAERTSFRYDGSLTTPPFSEGVKWIVFRHPIVLSEEHVGAFEALFPNENTREVQAPNGRVAVTDAALPGA